MTAYSMVSVWIVRLIILRDACRRYLAAVLFLNLATGAPRMDTL